MRKSIREFLEKVAAETGEHLPDRKDVTDTLKKAAGVIPFSKEVISGYYCAVDEKTPKSVKGVVAAALAYLVMPADAVPDILPAIGFTDDVSVLTTMTAFIASHMTDDHRRAAEELLATDGTSEEEISEEQAETQDHQACTQAP